MPLSLDQTALPLVRITYVEEYTDAELEGMLGELDALLQQSGDKVALIDLTKAKPGSAKQRQTHAQWIANQEAVISRKFAAAVIVTDSAIIRGTVTAVFWIRPLPIPTHITATAHQAEAWLAPYLARIAAG